MGGSSVDVPARIFMSYRREETAYPAGWLFDRLASRYGRSQIFKDIDSIDLGDDFVEKITVAVGSCDVLLALIGNRWLTITDQNGQRRLDNPSDFVRLEIESALTRNIRVIPILIDGAQMPQAAELPASLAAIARRQALELSPSRFEADTQRLLRVLDRAITATQEQAREEAEHAARDQPRIRQLQEKTREKAATQRLDDVAAIDDETAASAPATAASDTPASTDPDDITHRQEAEHAALPPQADGQSAEPGRSPDATAGAQGPALVGQAPPRRIVEPAPSQVGVAPHPVSAAGGNRPPVAADVPRSASAKTHRRRPAFASLATPSRAAW